MKIKIKICRKTRHFVENYDNKNEESILKYKENENINMMIKLF